MIFWSEAKFDSLRHTQFCSYRNTDFPPPKGRISQDIRFRTRKISSKIFWKNWSEHETLNNHQDLWQHSIWEYFDDCGKPKKNPGTFTSSWHNLIFLHDLTEAISQKQDGSVCHNNHYSHTLCFSQNSLLWLLKPVFDLRLLQIWENS